jgi:hypothetical protein
MSIDADTVAAVIEALAESDEYADKFDDLRTLRARVKDAETRVVLAAAEDDAADAKDDLVLDLVAELGSRKLVAA